jgi:DNA-binding transcriptional MerR regulator
MQVQELVQRTGVSATTIRYYKSIQLLPKPKRRANQYQNYAEADVECMWVLQW